MLALRGERLDRLVAMGQDLVPRGESSSSNSDDEVLRQADDREFLEPPDASSISGSTESGHRRPERSTTPEHWGHLTLLAFRASS